MRQIDVERAEGVRAHLANRSRLAHACACMYPDVHGCANTGRWTQPGHVNVRTHARKHTHERAQAEQGRKLDLMMELFLKTGLDNDGRQQGVGGQQTGETASWVPGLTHKVLQNMLYAQSSSGDEESKNN